MVDESAAVPEAMGTGFGRVLEVPRSTKCPEPAGVLATPGVVENSQKPLPSKPSPSEKSGDAALLKSTA